MIGDDRRAAHLAGKLTTIAQTLSLSRPPDLRVGHGQGSKGGAFALLFHAPLPQKKSDSQPMRRPVTFPKVPVAACREEPNPRPPRLR
jgi:hypothetical protein